MKALTIVDDLHNKRMACGFEFDSGEVVLKFDEDCPWPNNAISVYRSIDDVYDAYHINNNRTRVVVSQESSVETFMDNMMSTLNVSVKLSMAEIMASRTPKDAILGMMQDLTDQFLAEWEENHG